MSATGIRVFFRRAILLFCGILATSPAWAQTPRQAQVEQINTELRSARNRAEIVPVLQRRQARLAELLRTDPATVRSLLLDAAESRRVLAAAPEAAALLETEGTRGAEGCHDPPNGFGGLGLRFSPFATFTSFRLLTSKDIP